MLTADLTHTLEDILAGHWQEEIEEGRVVTTASDELAMAETLLQSTQLSDRSEWPIEDLVARDRLTALIARVAEQLR